MLLDGLVHASTYKYQPETTNAQIGRQKAKPTTRYLCVIVDQEVLKYD